MKRLSSVDLYNAKAAARNDARHKIASADSTNTQATAAEDIDINGRLKSCYQAR
jgi:hypothetical protein